MALWPPWLHPCCQLLLAQYILNTINGQGVLEGRAEQGFQSPWDEVTASLDPLVSASLSCSVVLRGLRVSCQILPLGPQPTPVPLPQVMLCVTPLQPSLLFPGPLAFDGLCGLSLLQDFKATPYVTASLKMCASVLDWIYGKSHLIN